MESEEEEDGEEEEEGAEERGCGMAFEGGEGGSEGRAGLGDRWEEGVVGGVVHGIESRVCRWEEQERGDSPAQPFLST